MNQRPSAQESDRPTPPFRVCKHPQVVVTPECRAKVRAARDALWLKHTLEHYQRSQQAGTPAANPGSSGTSVKQQGEGPKITEISIESYTLFAIDVDGVYIFLSIVAKKHTIYLLLIEPKRGKCKPQSQRIAFERARQIESTRSNGSSER